MATIQGKNLSDRTAWGHYAMPLPIVPGGPVDPLYASMYPLGYNHSPEWEMPRSRPLRSAFEKLSINSPVDLISISGAPHGAKLTYLDVLPRYKNIPPSLRVQWEWIPTCAEIPDNHQSKMVFEFSLEVTKPGVQRSFNICDVKIRDLSPENSLKGRGLTTRILTRLVAELSKKQYHRISLFADRNRATGHTDGYKVWPRLGFISSFEKSSETRNTSTSKILGVLPSVSALYDYEHGAAIWNQVGRAHFSHFDLTPTSESQLRLNAYRWSKGIIIPEDLGC